MLKNPNAHIPKFVDFYSYGYHFQVHKDEEPSFRAGLTEYENFLTSHS